MTNNNDKRYIISTGASAKAKKWTPVELTHGELISLLTKHTMGQKDGEAFVPGKLTGDGRRSNSNVQELHALVLDIDDGTPTDELVDKSQRSGLEAVIHTTHSHLIDTSAIRKEAVDRHRERHPEDGDAELLTKLKGFRPEIVEDATVIESKGVEDKNGKVDTELVFKHAPCPKHRVAFPLAHPFIVEGDRKVAAQLWEDLRVGLLNQLGLTGDKQTDDLARLYYFARHAEGTTPDSHLLKGKLLSLGDIDATPAVEKPSKRHTSGIPMADGSEDIHTGNRRSQGLYGRLAKAYSGNIENPTDYLVKQGYKLVKRNESSERIARLLPPTSKTGQPGTVVLRSSDDNLRVYTHNGSDTLNDIDAAGRTSYDILDLIAHFEFDQEHWDPTARRELAMRTAACRLKETHPQVISDLLEESDIPPQLTTLENRSALDLIENIAFSKVTNKYIDLNDGAEMIPQALNTVWEDTLPKPTAQKVFSKSPAKQIVYDVSWWPGKERIFKMEGCYYANPYHPTDMVANPRPGDVQRYLDLAERLIPDESQREYLFDIFAYTLQHQDKKMNVHPVVGGAPGIGKDTLIQPLLRGVGERHVSQIDEKAADSDYDDHIVHTKVVVVQEVHSFLGRRGFENAMKIKLASPPETLLANPKGRSKLSVPNIHTWVFMTNHYTPINISENDRRLFCIWCEMTADDAITLTERGYYRNLYDWLDAGGSAAVVAWLLKRDLSKFDPSGRAPMTHWKEFIQSQSGGAGSKATRHLFECDPKDLDRDLITIREMRELLPRLDTKISDADIADALKVGGAIYLGKGQKKIEGKNRQARVWYLHNHKRYKGMKSAELYECWLAENQREFDERENEEEIADINFDELEDEQEDTEDDLSWLYQ